jgi:hypothetical protein
MKATVRDGSMSFPQWGVDNPNRMLKKSSSGVLSSFRPSTYPRGYASDLHSLRPCWTAFLSILQKYPPIVPLD